MKRQWAYKVTVCDRKVRIVYTGKYIDSRRAEAVAQSWLSDTPNGTAYVYGRFDGSCLTLWS